MAMGSISGPGTSHMPQAHWGGKKKKVLGVKWEGMGSRVGRPNSWYSGHVGSQFLLGMASHPEHCLFPRVSVSAALTQLILDLGKGEEEE